MDKSSSKRSKAYEKAQRARLFREYREQEFQFLKIIETTNTYSIIRFGNHEYTIELKEGRIVFLPGGPRLSRDDYAFLCLFAENIMQAVFNGYKNVKKAGVVQTIKKGQPKNDQLQLPM